LSAGEEYWYNGIDRKDNSKGYVIDNCVPCHVSINRMKMAMPYEEFVILCKEVAEHIGNNSNTSSMETSNA